MLARECHNRVTIHLPLLRTWTGLMDSDPIQAPFHCDTNEQCYALLMGEHNKEREVHMVRVKVHITLVKIT